MISAHSHAFHRGMRGRSHIGQLSADSFLGWRNDMYAYVQALDCDSFYDLCKQTFKEMRRNNITTVGEFHYLHHSKARQHTDVDGDLYDFDRIILKAANDANIRIVPYN